MSGERRGLALGLHLGVLALLAALQLVLPAFHHGMVARVMVLAAYAVGYNLLLGYTGLMSLGHAMFFAAGMYGTGLTIQHWGFGAGAGFLAGIVSGLAVAAAVGLVTLRTAGPAFLIVTMMLAQAFNLAALYFNDVTGGDQGFILSGLGLDLFGVRLAFAHPAVKYNAAFVVFAGCLLSSLWLTGSPAGRVLLALKENEERTRLLGYNTLRCRLFAVVVSGLLSAVAGSTYTLLFSYVGSTFGSILYSIYPLLWTLLGGAGTTLGPLVGTLVMTYFVDIASAITTGYLIVVGAALIVMVLWAPAGIVGGIRKRWARWLP
ncbi:MAG: branched-chain amino acid ABC transporter permease [Candidatus Rokubacteria bacterium GWC2_70_16]|nr:MAG: branched-chain amino acid ABC transporter permease [Candidatus Rokubacteria bacterium GWC2_70_16]